MKKNWLRFPAFALAVVLLAPVAVQAQKEEKVELKEKKDVQQITIVRKSDNGEKIVVEINGDKVTVNGKPIDEYKDKGGDISVRLNKLKDMEHLTRIPGVSGNWNYNVGDNFNAFTVDTKRPMLGVSTEKTEAGVAINSITRESAAEKMGLKKGDIITKVDDKSIATPDDLTAAIKAHKPGDKVSVTYLRDKKEQKASAELTSWKTQAFKGMDMGNVDFDKVFPKIQGTTPRIFSPNGQSWSWSGGGPKLGLSVQDTDEGKGVKVIEVDDESNAAKAGIKKEDVVTEVDGKSVNSTDDMVKMIKESKDKKSIMVKLQRAGKTQNIEVLIPRKIKTADL